MSDTFKTEQRSEIMRRIKSKGNSTTEMKLYSFFKENEVKGWRRNYKLFGRPDFAFPKLKIAIFLDGCFWHGHDCRNTRPSNNKDYWDRKISSNMIRDIVVKQHLEKLGWRVVRIWECKLKDKFNLCELISMIKKE
jgi:DNA mismatch endonuclease, patch repair protein